MSADAVFGVDDGLGNLSFPDAPVQFASRPRARDRARAAERHALARITATTSRGTM